MRMNRCPPSTNLILCFIAAIFVILSSFYARPLIPVDETRYAAIAWNLWWQHHWLVPTFLGAPYADKPPLLFWLVKLGWLVMGVNELWLRLVPALFGLGSLGLTYRLARQLYPKQPKIASYALLLLLANGFWLLVLPLFNFDMMVVFFTLLVLNALVAAARQTTPTKQWRAVLLGALALGLGFLSKGPVILLYVSIVALAPPYWVLHDSPPDTQQTTSLIFPYKPWLMRIGFMLLGGVIIALIWVIPACLQGGAAYAHNLLFQQSADRLTHAFAHAKPWWWYFPLLGLLLLPWYLMPMLWNNTWQSVLRCVRHRRLSRSHRFLWLCLLPPFLLFVLISAKALRYLLPFLPLIAIGIAALLTEHRCILKPWHRWPIAAFIAIIGIAAYMLPLASHLLTQPAPWLTELSPHVGLPILLLAALWAARAPQHLGTYLAALAISLCAIVIIFLVGEIRIIAPIAYDVRPLATQLQQFEKAGQPVAYVGKYFGQYQFYGRLTTWPAILSASASDRTDWAKAHPSGWLLDETQGYYDKPYTQTPIAQFIFRDRRVLLWKASQLINMPSQ